MLTRSRTGALIVLLAACGAHVATPAAATDPVNPSPGSLATPAVSSPAPLPLRRTAPNVANAGLLDRIRRDGRSAAQVCLYVDPSTGVSAAQALLALRQAIDSLATQGYTTIAPLPSPCPQPPLFLRTKTVAPKNSGHGPVADPPIVTTPGPYMLFVTVTTSPNIAAIFGGVLRRGWEEVTCVGDNCGVVTESIYLDPAAYADAANRENAVLEGLGLVTYDR